MTKIGNMKAEIPKIIVVEDEFLIRLTLVEALNDEGFTVLEAETADAALPLLLDDDTIELLVTDIQLPGALDGHTLASTVRQHRPGLPVIFMTGRPDQHADQSSPLNVFIAKPYRLEEICDAAKRLMLAA